MKKQIEQVAEFMNLAGQVIETQPTFGPDDDAENRANLSIKLQREELEEMVNTLGNRRSMVDLADDIADQLYILFGTINRYGLQNYITSCFEEVHRSNMTKAHTTREEAGQTLMYWEKERGEIARIEEVGELFVVLNEHGKMLKNIHYERADLASVLAGKQYGFSNEEIVEAIKNTDTNVKPNKIYQLHEDGEALGLSAFDISGVGVVLYRQVILGGLTSDFIPNATIVVDSEDETKCEIVKMN